MRTVSSAWVCSTRKLMFTLLAPWLIICTLIPFLEREANASARIKLERDASQITVTIAFEFFTLTSATLERSAITPSRGVFSVYSKTYRNF